MVFAYSVKRIFMLLRLVRIHILINILFKHVLTVIVMFLACHPHIRTSLNSGDHLSLTCYLPGNSVQLFIQFFKCKFVVNSFNLSVVRPFLCIIFKLRALSMYESAVQWQQRILRVTLFRQSEKKIKIKMMILRASFEPSKY